MARLVDGFTLGGYPATLTLEQESVEVTSELPELDPIWYYRDKRGHPHWVGGDPADRLPTLNEIRDEMHWCSVCVGEYSPVIGYRCKICGEWIEPRTRISGRKFIPGVRRGEAHFTVPANKYTEFPPVEIVEQVGDEILTFHVTDSLWNFDGSWEFSYQVVDSRPIEEERMVKIEELDESVEPDGLYAKYRVFKEPEDVDEHPVEVQAEWRVLNEDGWVRNQGVLEEVSTFIFPLKPDTDRHARVALAAYAWSVKNEKPELHTDLMSMLEFLEY